MGTVGEGSDEDLTRKVRKDTARGEYGKKRKEMVLRWI